MNAPMTKFAIMRANRENQRQRQAQADKAAEQHDIDLEYQEWAARQRANAVNAARLELARKSKSTFGMGGWL